MSDSHSGPQQSEPEPKLRHEFVGMMFALTIGEVGLQAAALVQAGHVAHFLPAYSHLFLATVVVATSWLGWSLSTAPGARIDVQGVFQWEFLVLLLDVSLVITYFILVRTIDFGKEPTSPRTDPASTVAAWVVVIFLLYLAWDGLTKVVIYRRKREGQWCRNYGSRMLPTLVCVILALIIWREAQTADLPHFLTVDFALLSLVLAFRAGKDFVSAWLPKERASKKFIQRTKSPMIWTLVCLFCIVLGIQWTALELPLPLPESIIKAIETEPPKEKNRSDTPSLARQPEQCSGDRKESGGIQHR